MGLFDVNMLLIYGEGNTAFMRLQEQILLYSDDESILAWKRSSTTFDDDPESLRVDVQGCPATKVSQFADCGGMLCGASTRPHHALTNKGLLIDVQ